jgi:two-component system alkaline phosphatase synthesis response regulator PhoP
MSVGPAVVIIGIDGEPTSALASDIRRLSYRAHLVTWPGADPLWKGPPPLVVLADLRVLGADVGRVCQATREDPGLRRTTLVAVVSEQEAPRLDLSLGFDDLILSPYRLSELAARLRLIQWRTERAQSPDVVRAGSLAINPVTYQVAIEGRPVELTLKEYQLLLFFTRNAGRVFTREELLNHVWGDYYFGGTRTVDVHVRRLREKTEDAGELIETVRGVGYRFAVPGRDISSPRNMPET